MLARVVTLPIFQMEMSMLNAMALRNTVKMIKYETENNNIYNNAKKHEYKF